MRRELVTSTIAVLLFTVLLGVVFPLLITGIGQVAFPGDANGQKVFVNGRLAGSKIIGQSFKGRARYFQSRPSATEGGEYNAAASAFSNHGPNSKLTEQADAENVKTYLELNRPYDRSLTRGRVPVDAVNTSGSDLDPEISEANARIQAHRIAALRRVPLAAVDELIARYTSGRGLGFSGEPGVNVLELNLALDRLGSGGV